MAIPLSTTLISVYSRPSASEESDIPYSAPSTGATKTLKASNIRAVIGSLRGSGNESMVAGSEQSVATFSLNADPCDISHYDIVVDSVTGMEYEITWVVPVQGLGLDYMRGQMTLSKGTIYSEG